MQVNIALDSVGISGTVTGTVTAHGVYDVVVTGKTFDATSYQLVLAGTAFAAADTYSYATADTDVCVVSDTQTILTCTINTETDQLLRERATDGNSLNAWATIWETRSGTLGALASVEIPQGIVMIQNPDNVSVTAL